MLGGRDDLRNNVPLDSRVNQRTMRFVEYEIRDKARDLAVNATFTIRHARPSPSAERQLTAMPERRTALYRRTHVAPLARSTLCVSARA